MVATRTQIHRVSGFQINGFAAATHGFAVRTDARVHARAAGLSAAAVVRVSNRFWWGFAVAREIAPGTLRVWSKAGHTFDLEIAGLEG